MKMSKQIFKLKLPKTKLHWSMKHSSASVTQSSHSACATETYKCQTKHFVL